MTVLIEAAFLMGDSYGVAPALERLPVMGLSLVPVPSQAMF